MIIRTDNIFKNLTIGEIEFILTMGIDKKIFSDFMMMLLINEKLKKNEKEYNYYYD